MRTCPDCHSPIDDAAVFCDNCGLRLSKSASEPRVLPPARPVEAPPARTSVTAPGVCSTCGHVNVPGEMFCQNCGVQLAPVASVPPPPPVPVAPKPVSVPVVGAVPMPPASATIQPCPVCGYANVPGDMFCQNCGSQFPLMSEAGPAPAVFPAAKVEAAPEPPALSWQQMVGEKSMIKAPGKFIVRTTRAEVLFPAGKVEMTIGRSDPIRGIYPDIDLSTYGGETGGVSRVHARLILSEGAILIEDLNSTNFTFVNRQKLSPGQRYPLTSGDEVRLGMLLLEFVQVV